MTARSQDQRPSPLAVVVVVGLAAFCAPRAAAAACAYTLSADSIVTDANAATGSVHVTTALGCGWTVTKDAFISFTGATSGTGPGTVTFGVSENGAVNTPTAQRDGSILIAGRTLSVVQGGCAYLPGAPAVFFEPPGAPRRSRCTRHRDAGGR